MPGNGPHLESHLEFLTKMSAGYSCKISFNPGLMCLNLPIHTKNLESILPTQITVNTWQHFNPVTLPQPFESSLFSGMITNTSAQ